MEVDARSGSPRMLLKLHVAGPAGLSGPAGRIRLRRRALAILCYLAFEGATRRERLADLLWDTKNPLANLRVELNVIRSALEQAGSPGFRRHEDPLQLPDCIRREETARDVPTYLEGLDDLSPGFQEWLEWCRGRLRETAGSAERELQLPEALAGLRPPHLLVVEPLPFAGARPLAELLARRLELPFVAPDSDAAGVRLAVPPHPADLVSTIRSDSRSLWVFERNHFGADPDELLKLRYRLPAGQITYFRMEKTSWSAVRSAQLAGLPFAEAAARYLASGGQASFLTEQLNMPAAAGPAVPRKYGAALELELRRLPPDCRQLLESLAAAATVRPAPELLQTAPRACLDRLISERWLTYAGTELRFTSAFAVNLLRQVLPEAVRRAERQRLALLAAEAGAPVRAWLLQSRAAAGPMPPEVEAALEPWARELLSGTRAGRQLQPETMVPGEELYRDGLQRFGPGASRDGEGAVLVHFGTEGEASGVNVPLPGKAVIVRLSGRAFIRNQRGAGTGGNAVPLELRSNGTAAAVLAPGLSGSRTDAGLSVPLPETFDCLFAVPAARELTVETRAEQAVIELAVQLYTPAENGEPQEVLPFAPGPGERKSGAAGR